MLLTTWQHLQPICIQALHKVVLMCTHSEWVSSSRVDFRWLQLRSFSPGELLWLTLDFGSRFFSDLDRSRSAVPMSKLTEAATTRLSFANLIAALEARNLDTAGSALHLRSRLLSAVEAEGTTALVAADRAGESAPEQVAPGADVLQAGLSKLLSSQAALELEPGTTTAARETEPSSGPLRHGPPPAPAPHRGRRSESDSPRQVVRRPLPPSGRRLTRIRSDLWPEDEKCILQTAPGDVRLGAAADIGEHIVCGRSPCICTAKVLQMSQHPPATFTLPGQEPQTWIRYQVRDGKGYVGCSVCIGYAVAGFKLSARQALGRFMLRADDANNHGKDSVDGHVNKSNGDHQRALDELRKNSAPAVPEQQATREQMRDAVRPSRLQEKAAYWAYTCLH
jgi:hypothetical protein